MKEKKDISRKKVGSKKISGTFLQRKKRSLPIISPA
jgi:hypothetical protein